MVYCRLITINLQKSIVAQIYESFGLPLEHLGVDLLNVFKNKNTSKLHTEAMLVDLIDMAFECDVETSVDDIKEDLILYIKEIHRLMSKIYISETRLIGISLEGIDTVIFEYQLKERSECP